MITTLPMAWRAPRWAMASAPLSRGKWAETWGLILPEAYRASRSSMLAAKAAGFYWV